MVTRIRQGGVSLHLVPSGCVTEQATSVVISGVSGAGVAEKVAENGEGEGETACQPQPASEQSLGSSCLRLVYAHKPRGLVLHGLCSLNRATSTAAMVRQPVSACSG